MKAVKVRFPGQMKANTFLIGHLSLKYGERVVAMSDRGLAIGYVNSQPFEADPTNEEIHKIKRIATEEDIEKYKSAYQNQREAKQIFSDLVQKHALKMNLVDIEHSSCGKKITFYYTAPERIDFRGLLKDLIASLRIKIELLQIPANKSIGKDIGPCGVELCTFINSLMPDNSPQSKKCSESFCCLEFKDPFYEDKRSRLPRVGDIIMTKNGEVGRVERLDLWHEEFEMLTNQGIMKRYVSAYFKEKLNRNSAAFPKSFETISFETKTVIGLDEIEKKKKMMQEEELLELQNKSKEFAEETFRNLTR